MILFGKLPKTSFCSGDLQCCITFQSVSAVSTNEFFFLLSEVGLCCAGANIVRILCVSSCYPNPGVTVSVSRNANHIHCFLRRRFNEARRLTTALLGFRSTRLVKNCRTYYSLSEKIPLFVGIPSRRASK